MSRAKLKPTTAAMAEFETADAMVAAVKRLQAAGYTTLDMYTPYPIHGSDELLKLKRSPVPYIVFTAGMCGAAGAYGLQWFLNAFLYPLNVGGRPPHAGPAFIIVTFEMGVLFAALTAFAIVFVLAGLPRLWHPIFEIEGFERASIDRFWISVESDDPKYGAQTRADLEATNPLRTVFLATETDK
jgi:hypothetical protein